MSRAHCLDCGDHVVIDPAGRCPEGHDVGIPGARIEGALGSGSPHPDEPEPWVARVELDADLSPPPTAMPVRQVRPPAAPPAPAPAVVTSPPARTEDLMRELHSLGDLVGPSAAAGDTFGPRDRPGRPPAPKPAAPPRLVPPLATEPPSAAPTLPVAPPPSSAATTPPPAASTVSGTARDDFDELTALEAAVHALSSSNGHGHAGGTDGNGHRDGAGHADGNGNGHRDGAGHADGNGNGHRDGAGHVNGAAQPRHVPPTEVSRTIADQLDDLFAAADLAPAASARHPRSEPTARSLPPPSQYGDVSGPERSSVLAHVAEFADRPTPVPAVDLADLAFPDPPTLAAPGDGLPPPPLSAPPPPAGSAPAPTPAPAGAGIDLANFTASGKRVGGSGKGKRRLFGR